MLESKVKWSHVNCTDRQSNDRETDTDKTACRCNITTACTYVYMYNRFLYVATCTHMYISCCDCWDSFVAKKSMGLLLYFMHGYTFHHQSTQVQVIILLCRERESFKGEKASTNSSKKYILQRKSLWMLLHVLSSTTSQSKL